MVDRRRPVTEEDEIAGSHRRTPGHRRSGIELILGHPGKIDAPLLVGGLGEAGTVEAPIAGAAPQVGRVQLLGGERQRGDDGAGGLRRVSKARANVSTVST